MALNFDNGVILPCFAATQLGERVPVAFVAGATARIVAPVASLNEQSIGFTQTAASPGLPVAVQAYGNVVRAVAAASVGAGAEVALGSPNGALGPVTGASGVVKYSSGTALSAAAGAETFSVYVNPRQLSGIA